MIVDLHNHTTEYSYCSDLYPDKLIRLYINAGIDAICITEHDHLWWEEKRAVMEERYKGRIKIFFGTEVTTDIGHVLLFGSNVLGFSGYTYWEYLEELIDREKVALIWAHPFRWESDDEKILTKDKKFLSDPKKFKEILKKFDAVELYNFHVQGERLELTKRMLEPFNLKLTGGSDSHEYESALTYATEFENSFTTIEELVQNIKHSKYKPIILDKEEFKPKENEDGP